jgi:PAS domain S-box-containing protein
VKLPRTTRLDLRARTLILIGTAIAALFFCLFILLQLTLGRDIRQLNDLQSRQSCLRALNAIQATETEVRALLVDYAAWDDTYRFMADYNEAYIQSNLVYDVFPNCNLNLLLIYDDRGQLVTSRLLDPAEQQFTVPPADVSALIPASSPLLQGETLDDIETGLISFHGRLLVIAAGPILTTTNEGPSRGTWVYGRDIAEQEAATFSSIIGAKFELLPLTTADHSALAAPYQGQRDEPVIDIAWQGQGTLVASTILPDVFGHPVAMLRTTEEGKLLKSTRRYSWVLALTLLACGSGLAIIVLLYVGLNLLNPLARLSRAVESFDTGSELQLHVPVTGSGELAALGEAVNRMLARLRRVHQELASSEYQYRRLVEMAQEGILVIDPQDNINFANPAICRILGYEREELLKLSIYDILAPIHHDTFAGDMELRRQGAVATDQRRMRTKDGETRELLVTACPLFDPDGHYEGALGVLYDITERQRNERALQESQKLESLGMLAGGIAHDFNNILVGIMGNADLARSELPPDSPARQLIGAVIDASQRAAELTRQMLAYAGRGQIVLSQIDLNDLVQDMLPLLGAALPKNTRIELRLAPQLPLFKGDATQLRQVVLNLILNGAEALYGASGRVRVETELVQASADDLASPYLTPPPPPGSYIQLQITDDGSGMDEHTLHKLFDPFYSTKFAGRGLGLAAVLGIVRSHNGTIRVSSSPGQGSRFRVLLPVEATAIAAVAGAAAADRQLDTALASQLVVLVVDDENSVRRVTLAMLRHLGATTLEACDGEQALALYRQHGAEIGAVLLDLSMPRMTGREVFEALRALNPGLPVILMSGYTAFENEAQVDGPQPTAFLEKPFTRRQLLDTLTRYLTPTQA